MRGGGGGGQGDCEQSFSLSLASSGQSVVVVGGASVVGSASECSSALDIALPVSCAAFWPAGEALHIAATAAAASKYSPYPAGIVSSGIGPPPWLLFPDVLSDSVCQSYDLEIGIEVWLLEVAFDGRLIIEVGMDQHRHSYEFPHSFFAAYAVTRRPVVRARDDGEHLVIGVARRRLPMVRAKLPGQLTVICGKLRSSHVIHLVASNEHAPISALHASIPSLGLSNKNGGARQSRSNRLVQAFRASIVPTASNPTFWNQSEYGEAIHQTRKIASLGSLEFCPERNFGGIRLHQPTERQYRRGGNQHRSSRGGEQRLWRPMQPNELTGPNRS